MNNTSWVDHSESFGDTVRQMREARGWTRADLLRELDKIGYCMHATVLARIEKGDRIARVAEALAIAQLFGTTVEEMNSVGMSDKTWAIIQLNRTNSLFADTGTRLSEIIEHWLEERQTLRRRIEAVEGCGVTEEDDDLSTAYQLLAEFGTLDAIQKHVVIKRKRESAG